MNRYKVVTYRWAADTPLKTYRAGEISRVTIEDLFNDRQVVVTFSVKECKRLGGNPDYYGVSINNAALAEDMADRLCNQMNLESGYAIRMSNEPN